MGTIILFFANPMVNADPNIPIEIKIGVPINKVDRIIKEFINGISNNTDIIGIKNIIGKQVNVQHDIILKNKTNSIGFSDVK
tara:strand:+ start:559 stop:804 length:246 start_codon:yes stop_codon:yes gene_type:complete